MDKTNLLPMILLELEQATKDNTEYNKGKIDICKKVLKNLSFEDAEINNIITKAKEIIR